MKDKITTERSENFIRHKKNMYDKYSDDGLKEQLKSVCIKIHYFEKEADAGRTFRADLFLELRLRGYSYKEIAEISNCSTSLVFKEVLKWERFIKKIQKDQPGVLNRSSLY